MRANRTSMPGLVRALAASAIALGLGLVVLNDGSAAAKEEEGEKAEPTMDKRIGKKMNKAIELMNQDKYAEARKILEDLEGRRFISPYELARVENLLAWVSQGQHKYGEAREHLKKAIASGGFNDQEIISAKFQLAQLYMVEERWKEGIDALKAWLASGVTPTPNAYYLLAVAYYQLKKYDSALEYAQKAVSMTDKPQEGWLQLLLALRLSRDQYKESLPILIRLVELAPTKGTYWTQLSNVYSMLNRFSDALVAAQIAFTGGMATDEASLRRVVDLNLHANIPHRAARILSAAIEQKKIAVTKKDWEKLSICWIASREFDKAVKPMDKAASMADTGDLYLRLAEIHIEREDWAKAIKSLKKATDKGKMKDPGNSEIMMGIALMNLKKFKEAKGYFQRASKNDKLHDQAVGWINYVDAMAKSQ